MKKTVLSVSLAIAMGLLASCGGESASNQETSTNTSTNKVEKTTETVEKQETVETTIEKREESTPVVEETTEDDCSAFLDEYEEFVDDYIDVLKKYKANPSDMSILSDYQEMAAKATEMQNDAKNCSSAKYANRVNKITQKLTKALY